MLYIKNFSILGGDKRQIALMKSLVKDGIKIFAAGFDNIAIDEKIIKTNFDEAIKKSEYILLPLPATRDFLSLNAPFCDEKILLKYNFPKKLFDKKVFCGVSQNLRTLSPEWKKVDLIDYSSREEFTIRNSVPAAEGAVALAMQKYEGTIFSSKCLVAGFGKLGRALSHLLFGMGAKVTVSARKLKDLAWIESLNYKAILTKNIKHHSNFDIIFNTIPYMIFDAYTLAKSAKRSILIDLASAPGGVDFDAAKTLGIKAILALSLPGKCAPKTAGLIIKSTIYEIIEEINRRKKSETN
ncbi:MAG: dipicolinate synthase subunit DpsA [Oscillospiraceae bacterium]|jgi:dipicolinate synthase subunit A|nr:dipicolinate synthase subunit DpsA [Oscillospiraceae bacterium]